MFLKNVLYTAIILATSVTAQSCTGQSCDNAAWSGSSGAACPSSAPSGGSSSGNACIATYPGSCTFTGSKRSLGFGSSARRNLKLTRRVTKKRATCKPYILLFARGTSEPGAMGVSVGPALKSALSATNFNKWDISGIDYDASIAGDYCLGLPGGVIATQALEEAISDCPDSLIFASGYSEGGMVVHNGVANLDDSVKSRVTGIVIFGDPFNGAPIKGYSGPIKTICSSSDLVCSGQFIITLTHLTYDVTSITPAVTWIEGIINSN